MWPTAVQVAASGPLTFSEDSLLRDWFPEGVSERLVGEEIDGAADSAVFEHEPSGTLLELQESLAFSTQTT